MRQDHFLFSNSMIKGSYRKSLTFIKKRIIVLLCWYNLKKIVFIEAITMKKISVKVALLVIAFSFTLSNVGMETETDEIEEPPIILAIRRGDINLVELLLQQGTSPNSEDDGTTALMLAAEYGRAEIVKLLLKYEVESGIQDESGNTALMIATQYGYSQIVKVLLEHEADPNIRAHDGTTTLTLAAEYGYPQIVTLLLEHEANPDLQDGNGETALIIATAKGNLEIARLLLKGGSDPNKQNENGVTALTMAASKGHLGIAKLLLENGACIDVKDLDGETALMSAAKRSLKVVELLLRCGADPTCQDGKGKRVLMWARSRRIEQLLLAYGAVGASVLGAEDEQSKLNDAALKGNLMGVKELLCRSVKFKHVFPLILASAKGNDKIVSALLEHFKLSNKSKLLENLVWHAAVNGRSEVVGYLLSLLKPNLEIPGKRALLQNKIRKILENIEKKAGISVFAENVPFYMSSESEKHIQAVQLSSKGLLSTIRFLYSVLPVPPFESRIVEQISAGKMSIYELAGLSRH
jgi:ankyrin repeat protein